MEGEKHMTPIKAIRAKCKECCGNSPKGVAACAMKNCALYPFRLGKNPNIKLSAEEKARRGLLLQKSPEPSADKIQ